jgi:hypothetical protein
VRCSCACACTHGSDARDQEPERNTAPTAHSVQGIEARAWDCQSPATTTSLGVRAHVRLRTGRGGPPSWWCLLKKSQFVLGRFGRLWSVMSLSPRCPKPRDRGPSSQVGNSRERIVMKKTLASLVVAAAMAAPLGWASIAGAKTGPDPDANGDVHSNCHTGSKFRGAGGEDNGPGRPKDTSDNDVCAAAPVTPPVPPGPPAPPAPPAPRTPAAAPSAGAGAGAVSAGAGAAAVRAPAVTSAAPAAPVVAAPRTTG